MRESRISVARAETFFLILNNHQRILKIHIQGYLFFCLDRSCTNETYEADTLAVVVHWSRVTGGTAIFTESSCFCPAQGKFLLFSGRTRQGCFKIADLRLCTLYRRIHQAHDSGENGKVQLSWSGQRYMVEFCTIINGTYWTLRTLIRRTQSGFC